MAQPVNVSPSRDTLEREKKKGLRSLRRSRVAVRAYTLLAISWNAHVFFQMYQGRRLIATTTSGEISVGLTILIFLVGVFWFFWLGHEGRKLAPLQDESLLRLVRELAARQGIQPDQIAIVIDGTKKVGGPKVMLTKRGVEVQLSGPFLKLLSRDPEAAAATLQHEFAHIVHKDVGRSFTYRFWHVFSRITVLNLALATFGTSLFLLFNYVSFGRELAFKVGGGHVVINSVNSEGQHQEIEERLPNVDLEGPVLPVSFAVKIVLYTFVAPVGIWLFLVLSLRRERMLSEKMADLEVILESRGRDLVTALDFFAGKHGRAGLFALHPSVAWRKRYILARV